MRPASPHVFTSESVTEGHPDKLCDQISDAVLDAVMEHDPTGRVACETFATTGLVLVGGEITTEAEPDIQHIVRNTVEHIGYTDAQYGLDSETVGVLNTVVEQSPDIAQGVVDGDELGAGDQGHMFGYATNETEQLMPLPILLAHQLTQQLATVRKDNTLSYLRPDGKSQISIRYENGEPQHVENIVLAAQHDETVDVETLRSDVKEHIIHDVVPDYLLHEDTDYHINAAGTFVRGGPHADAGLTGRKVIVDTYGGIGSHGGGCFSGKDPTKVDRSASYMARYIAKNIVAAGLAEECEIQLSYAIGEPEPTSILVNTYNTGDVTDQELLEAVRETFDLTPTGIINTLELRQPLYQDTAAYGHFGRSQFPWEETDNTQALHDNL